MKGLDTNVLVRYLVADDEFQHRKAVSVMQSGESLFVSHIVLCELVWVLDSCYDCPKEKLLEIIERLLTTKQLTVQDSDVAWKAFFSYQSSKKADFSDCLILAIHSGHDVTETVSFDKGLREFPNVKVLS